MFGSDEWILTGGKLRTFQSIKENAESYQLYVEVLKEKAKKKGNDMSKFKKPSSMDFKSCENMPLCFPVEDENVEVYVLDCLTVPELHVRINTITNVLPLSVLVIFYFFYPIIGYAWSSVTNVQFFKRIVEFGSKSSANRRLARKMWIW